MSHEHEWIDFGMVTSWSVKYQQVQMCKFCRTFHVLNNEGEWSVIT